MVEKEEMEDNKNNKFNYKSDFLNEYFNSTTKYSLEEILRQIKIGGDNSFYIELLKHKDVKRHINNTIGKYRIKKENGGYFIDYEYLIKLCQSVLMEVTFRWYHIDWNNYGIENGYLSFLSKYLQGNFWQQIKKEREDIFNNKLTKRIEHRIKKSLLWSDMYIYDSCNDKFIDNSINYFEDEYIECNNKGYKVELYGNIENLIEVEKNGININTLSSTYGKEFIISQNNEEQEDKFNHLISCLTDRQQEVVKLLLQKKYTQQEAANELGVSRRNIRNLFHRSINNLKKKYKLLK
jgi:RNA polymerase sigma factor (sigma-70 family)